MQYAGLPTQFDLEILVVVIRRHKPGYAWAAVFKDTFLAGALSSIQLSAAPCGLIALGDVT